jgi:hypothetical protein
MQHHPKHCFDNSSLGELIYLAELGQNLATLVFRLI